jgi:RNA polymerase sigma-70 factor (ECF subfamily)
MDDRNWQQWFDRHGAALILFARQRADCCADAEDIVQTAFIRFWKHRESAKDPLTYLYSCVSSVSNDRYRSDSRRREREKKAWYIKADDANVGGASSSNSDTAFEPTEIEEAMATLPEEQRQVVVLKIWGELTFNNIAEVLSIPANTAASRYRLAINVLKSRLSEGAES